MPDNKHEQTLKDALAQVQTCQATISELKGNLATESKRADDAVAALTTEKTAHNVTKAELETAKQKSVDFDKAVAAKAAEIAAQSGVETPPPASSNPSGDDIESLQAKYAKATPSEKAALLEKYEKIIIK